MEVRPEQGIVSSSEQFGVGLQTNPVQPQPLMQNMRLAFTPDGTAIYKQVNSRSPTYHGAAAGAGEAPGGGGDGAVPTMSPYGLNLNMAEPVKRKRGRPRKYGLDGTMSLGLNPASASPVVAAGSAGFSSLVAGVAPNPAFAAALKKQRGRPLGSGKKQRMAALGSAGIGFTAHIITINVGEDVYSKIMSLSQHGPHAFCILSANGAISNVTLRQFAMSGGTVTYEGRFEILSLSGSFLLSESGGQCSRTGGLSISLAGPDGRVLGGGVAGLLTAASPVQVVVGSFIADGPRECNHQTDPSELSSVAGKLTPGVTAGTSSLPLHLTLGESSGGPGSPFNNQSSAAFNDSGQQGMSSMTWK